MSCSFVLDSGINEGVGERSNVLGRDGGPGHRRQGVAQK